MITPLEMSEIYWRRIRAGSVYEIAALIQKLKSRLAKEYWTEVLAFLNARKNGKRTLQ